MKAILSFHSQVAGARVGNSVAAFASERLGVQVLQMPTTLLGRRPDRGAPGGGPVAAETLSSMLDALEADGRLAGIGAVFCGYLAAEDQVAVMLDAAERVKKANPAAVLVCDPIAGDEDKGLYVRPEIADALFNGLAPHADWLMPNAFELGLITARRIDGLEAARDAARRLGKPVLVSSIPTETGPNGMGLGVLYAAPGGDWFAETARLPRAPRGTGDLLAALFLARRLLGQAPAVALEASLGAVYDVIVRALAAESDDLPLPEAQDLLADPRSWPKAQSLGV